MVSKSNFVLKIENLICQKKHSKGSWKENEAKKNAIDVIVDSQYSFANDGTIYQEATEQ